MGVGGWGSDDYKAPPLSEKMGRCQQVVDTLVCLGCNKAHSDMFYVKSKLQHDYHMHNMILPLNLSLQGSGNQMPHTHIWGTRTILYTFGITEYKQTIQNVQL